MLPFVMLDRSPISARAVRPSLRPIQPSSLAILGKNAALCFQSIAHSFQFAIPSISRTFCALRTLCEKHPGVGIWQASQISDPTIRPLNPMESHCFTMNLHNHFRITLFHRIPGGGVLHTSSLSLIRHFARVNAKLVLPARSLLGGAR